MEGLKGMMKRDGIVFDVAYTLGGEVQLVEVNPYGAMSGCGSCVFDWIGDARVLYGMEGEIEVRIVVDGEDV